MQLEHGVPARHPRWIDQDISEEPSDEEAMRQTQAAEVRYEGVPVERGVVFSAGLHGPDPLRPSTDPDHAFASGPQLAHPVDGNSSRRTR